MIRLFQTASLFGWRSSGKGDRCQSGNGDGCGGRCKDGLTQFGGAVGGGCTGVVIANSV